MQPRRTGCKDKDLANVRFGSNADGRNFVLFRPRAVIQLAQVAAATASISISTSSANNCETSTSVIAGAAVGVVDLRKRSRALRYEASRLISRTNTASLTRLRGVHPTDPSATVRLRNTWSACASKSAPPT